jgi:hypothetical protein
MGESSAGQTGPVKYLATDRPDKPAGFRNTRTWIYFFPSLAVSTVVGPIGNCLNPKLRRRP